MTFVENVLHAPHTHHVARAVILGLWTRQDLGPEIARAFLRHAFGCFYNDFSNVDLNEKVFLWQVPPGVSWEYSRYRAHDRGGRREGFSSSSAALPYAGGSSDGVSSHSSTSRSVSP